MFLALQTLLRSRTPAHLLVRAAVVALLATIVALSFSRLNRDLQVSFDMRAERAGPFQFYYAGPDAVFNERQNVTRYTKAGVWQRHTIEINSLRQFTQIRMDPITEPGTVEIGVIEISSRWGQLSLVGPSFQAAMFGMQDLVIDGVAPDVIRLHGTGSDPHFLFQLPRSVIKPRMAQQLPTALLVGLVAGLLWLVLDVALDRLKRKKPQHHARLGRIAARGLIVPLVVCLALTYRAADRISDDPILGDGIQNLLMAVNVFKHNTFSLDTGERIRPTNFREPLDPLLVGLHLKLAVPEAVNRPFADFRSGEFTRTVKLSNLLWVYTGLVGIWLLTLRVGGTNLTGFIATGLAFQIFFHGGTYIDTLYTELSTATLMIWATYGLLAWFLGSGVLMGLLALGKASFVYIGLAAVPLLMLALLVARRPDRFAFSRVMIWGLAMTTTFLLTLSPWLVRNEVQFGNMRITERGGLILWGRAHLNNMSNDEVLGLIYDGSPTLYKRAVAGTKLAAAPGDFERGGRWQRHNRYRSTFWETDRRAAYEGKPENAISFHYKAAAQANQRVFQLRDQGHPNPDQAVGDELKAEAFQLLKERPWRHLAMTLPFFWHGFWSFKKVEVPWVSLETQDAIGEVLNLLAGVALFGVFLYGLLRRHAQWVAVTVLPVGLLVFYAFLSHNIPRYSTPAHPMMLLAFVLVLRTLWLRWRARGRRAGPQRLVGSPDTAQAAEPAAHPATPGM
jgi:hypothetical protein